MRKVTFVLFLLLVFGSFPAQAQDVYLPLVAGSTARPIDTRNIHLCSKAELDALNDPQDTLDVITASTPDDGCILPSETFPGDVHNLIFQDDKQVQSSAIDYWTWPRRVALYRLDCYTWPGCSPTDNYFIDGVQGLFPARNNTLPSGRSWSDHFIGNWSSIGLYTSGAICGTTTRPHVLIGIGQGRFSSSYTSTTPKIFVERYSGYYGCTTTVVTGYTPSATDVHYLQMYVTGYGEGNVTYWTARYRRNGQWYYIWTDQPYDIPGWYLMIGGESGADTLAHADLPEIDLQYISKIQLYRISFGWKSYHDKHIGYLSGLTTKQVDSPMVMTSYNTGYSYTSLGWEMNSP